MNDSFVYDSDEDGNCQFRTIMPSIEHLQQLGAFPYQRAVLEAIESDGNQSMTELRIKPFPIKGQLNEYSPGTHVD